MTNMKITKSNLLIILDSYNLGRLKSFKDNSTKTNTLIKIITVKGKYIVKIFSTDNKEKILDRLKILKKIEEKSVLVPKIIENKNKELITKYKRRYLVIQEFIEGKHPKTFSNKLTIDCAKKIAKLHKELLKIPRRGKYVFHNYKIFPFAFRAKCKTYDGFNHFDKEKEIISNIKTIKLRKSILHTDIQASNIIVIEEKLNTIIDWDDMREFYLVYDIAVFLGFSFVNSKKADIEKINLFLKHYEKINPLNPQEKKALLSLIKYSLISNISWLIMHKKKMKDKSNKTKQEIKDSIKKYMNLDKASELFSEA